MVPALGWRAGSVLKHMQLVTQALSAVINTELSMNFSLLNTLFGSIARFFKKFNWILLLN